MAYVFVTGDGKVAAPITVENYIKQILRWISFTIEEHRNMNYDHSIESFSEIRMFKENMFLIYQLDFPEGLRILGRYTLGCAEQNV